MDEEKEEEEHSTGAGATDTTSVEDDKDLNYWRAQPGIEDQFWDEFDDHGRFVNYWLLLYQRQANGERKLVYMTPTY